MSLTCRVPAKINLTLEVLGKRPDGYHEVATLMQAISLYDTLSFTPAPRISVHTIGATIDGEDLCEKAALSLAAHRGVTFGAAIAVEKRIPISAGLGGGSADAAATLVGLDALWDTDLSFAELTRLAAELGSDVPFFLAGGSAVACGRGEQINRLSSPVHETVVVLTPPSIVGGKTARAYGALEPGMFSDGEQTRHAAAGDRAAYGYNTFDAVRAQLYPELQPVVTSLTAAGLTPVLAGAGPSLFLLFADEPPGWIAREVAASAAPGWRVELAQCVDEGVTLEAAL